MTFTDYYKAEKLTDAKCRFDITASTGEYNYFERNLSNKRGFNVGGLSLNCVSRPERWKGKKTDLAITKGSDNITSIKRPDPNIQYAFGDIKGTNDSCILVFNSNFKKIGISTIEIFIARGLRNDINSLWDLLIDGEFQHEFDTLRGKAVTKNVTKP